MEFEEKAILYKDKTPHLEADDKKRGETTNEKTYTVELTSEEIWLITWAMISQKITLATAIDNYKSEDEKGIMKQVAICRKVIAKLSETGEGL